MIQKGETYELLLNGKSFNYIKMNQAAQSYNESKITQGFIHNEFFFIILKVYGSSTKKPKYKESSLINS